MAATGHIARGLLVTLIAWQLVIWVLAPPHYMMPSPQAVGAVFASRTGLLLFHLGITGIEVLAGLVIGTASGIGVALLIVALPRLGNVVWPIVLVLQALPVFAIASLLVLWFGFGMASKAARGADSRTLAPGRGGAAGCGARADRCCRNPFRRRHHYRGGGAGGALYTCTRVGRAVAARVFA